VVIARSKKKIATKERLEKKSGGRNMDNRLRIQLEKQGGGSIRQNWMEITSVACGLCSYAPLGATQDISQVVNC